MAGADEAGSSSTPATATSGRALKNTAYILSEVEVMMVGGEKEASEVCSESGAPKINGINWLCNHDKRQNHFPNPENQGFVNGSARARLVASCPPLYIFL